jgi:hypothetical protein
MIVDLFLVYQFLKRLATPFENWEAYKLGIIDAEGNILKSRKELRTVKERDAWGKFDLMISKLKRLIAKVPGGQTKLASYAAALWLIKEHSEHDEETLTEEQLSESFGDYFKYVKENREDDINSMFETAMTAAPVNSAGSGAVAGIGVGEDGEPGLTKSQMKQYKKRKKPIRTLRDIINHT